MRGREPIMPERRRRIPAQFSWVDHRLVRDGHLQGRSAPALALYLFLLTVADADGLSWYSESALCGHLSWEAPQLHQARGELQRAELIAYRRPLYQVLDLGAFSIARTARHSDTSRPRHGEAAAIGTLLDRLLANGAGAMENGARP
jgi:hypothetical protein